MIATHPVPAQPSPALTTTSGQEPAETTATVETVASAILTALTAATWPDGSPLIDLDPSVLDQRLRPHILTALTAVTPPRGETP